MSVVTKFSDVCGESINISEEGKVATWVVPAQSGGWVYCKRPLPAGGSASVTVNGSGHYQLGFISTNPDNMSPSADVAPCFKQINDVRLHRKSCTISMARDASQVTTVYNDTTYKRNVESGRDIWAAVCVRYGGMEMTVKDSDGLVEFSSRHGNNISLSDDGKKASIVKKNPASVCVLHEPLLCGERVTVHCSPLPGDGDRPPRTYELSLQVRRTSPESLRKDFPYLYSRTHRPPDPEQFKDLVCLDKSNCDAHIAITRVDRTKVEYNNGKGVSSSIDLDQPVPDSLWIAFDLYRVRLTIVKKEVFTDSPDGPVPVGNMFDETHVKTFARQQSLNIQKNFVFLIDNLIPIPFIDYLYQENKLTYSELTTAQNLANNRSPADANRYLLPLMVRRQVQYHELEFMLEETQQAFLLPKFFPDD